MTKKCLTKLLLTLVSPGIISSYSSYSFSICLFSFTHINTIYFIIFPSFNLVYCTNFYWSYLSYCLTRLIIILFILSYSSYVVLLILLHNRSCLSKGYESVKLLKNLAVRLPAEKKFASKLFSFLFGKNLRGEYWWEEYKCRKQKANKSVRLGWA